MQKEGKLQVSQLVIVLVHIIIYSQAKQDGDISRINGTFLWLR